MKANELRIGNYVWIELGLPSLDVHRILPIDISQIAGGIKVAPIPLNEEWLIKFGFQKSGMYHFKDDVYIWDTYELCTKTNDYAFYYYPVNYSKRLIMYVHQLQNLYFALTGNELCLK